MPKRLLLCALLLFPVWRSEATEPEVAVATVGSLRGEEAKSFVANADVTQMVLAGFEEATILSAIGANESRFDVSPGALISLKQAGVSESLIRAMLAVAMESRSAAAAAVSEEQAPVDAGDAALSLTMAEAPNSIADATPADAAPAILPAPPISSQADEQPPAARADLTRTPRARAWLDTGSTPVELTSNIAQIAFADGKRTSNGPVSSLQSIGTTALAFANPALGLASELGQLFRVGDPTVTAVWALPGATAAQRLSAGETFTVDFRGIPGINPADYRPVVLRLVATDDNFRLVSAVRTKASRVNVAGPFVEEPADYQSEEIERGRYRVSFRSPPPSGEYALVLRPVVLKQSRREPPSTFGELLGTDARDALYITWDFGVDPTD